MTTLYIILGIVALLLVLLFVSYNSLVRLRNKAREGYSTMDVCLKKRFDMIPALVEVVRGYAGHEADVLLQVAERRSRISGDDLAGRLHTEEGIGNALKQIFVVAEAYPQLKADTNFLTLQQQIVKMEDELSLSRRYYNGCVRMLNNQCQVFPQNIVAALFGFKPMPMFAVDSDDERRTTTISL